MRTRTVAALALMLALPVSGCAGAASNDPQVASAQTGTAKPSAAPSVTASEDPDAPLKFSQCMREHGVTDFPDPVEGRLSFGVPKGADMTKIDAAQEACKQFMPNGGRPQKPSAEMLEQTRAMAKCMRENGVPDFPDPDPDGGLAIDASKMGTGPGDPTFDKAEKACSKYVPEGARTEKHTDGGPGAIVGRAG